MYNSTDRKHNDAKLMKALMWLAEDYGRAEAGEPTPYLNYLRDEVSKGNLCISCKSTDVSRTTSAPDGLNINQSYICNECGKEWEGY